MNTIISLTIRGDSVLCGTAPRFKCYFDPTPIIAASAATTQAVANQFAGSSATADSDAARAYDFWKTNNQRQAQLQDLERAYKENQINRDWSEAQRISEQDWQEYLQKEMFRMQNNYNTPARQVHRLIAGGLLPAGVFGQTGSATTPMTGAPSAPGTPSGPSAPGIPTPASGGVPAFLSSAPYDSMIGTILGGAAEVLDKLASAKQKGVETQALERKVPLLLEQLGLDNQMKTIQVTLARKYGDKEASQKIDKLKAETDNLLASAQKELAEKGYIDEKAFGEKYRSLSSYKELEILGVKYELLHKELETFDEKFLTAIYNLRADTQEKREHAKLYGEQSETEDTLRSLRGNLLDVEYKIRNQAHSEQLQTAKWRIKQDLWKLYNLKACTYKELAVAQKYIDEHNTYYIDKIIQWVESATRSQNNVANTMKTSLSAGSLGALLGM